MRRSTLKKKAPTAKRREADILSDAINHAVGCQGQGRLADAEALYERVLKVRPRHFDALHLLGVLRQQQGRSDEALRMFAAALKVSPDSADALSNRGVALNTLERWDEALASYDRALAVEPNHVDALINQGHTFLKLRRFEQALASCEHALALDSDHPIALNNRGHALIELKRPAEALAMFERALAINPGHGDVIANVGRALQELGRLDDALKYYDEALARNPEHAESLSNRGLALSRLERFDEALTSLDRALALRPDFPEALSNRGNVLRVLDRYDEAMADYGHAISLCPNNLVAFNNRGVAFNELNRCADALENFEQALTIRPDHAEVHFNRSLALLTEGRFREGWGEYEWRWKQDGWTGRRRNFSQPFWLGPESVAGRTILLHAEQGFGDTLQFVRYGPLLAARGARVLLDVQPPLRALVASLEGTAVVAVDGDRLPPFDLHCPLMSLPLAFGTELGTVPANVPYIRPDADRVAKWQRRLGEQKSVRVGIAWTGSQAHRNNRNRSIPLDRFADLLSVPGVEFVSIQKDLSAADSTTLGAHSNVRVIGGELGDFADTAAVIAQLDLVVSVDTSLVHLAGALGKPVWVMLPFSPDFRWLLEREDSPWYPTARLFRQPRRGDWQSVIVRVRDELTNLKCVVGGAASRPMLAPVVSSIEQALAFHRQDRLDEAEHIYRAVLDVNPAHFDALHLYGVLKHQQGQSVEALRLVAAALEADSRSAPALSNYGVILEALGRHEEALASFEQALASSVGDASTLYNWSNALAALGRHEEALAGFDKALALQPRHVDALKRRGNALGALKRHEEALASYDAALAVAANDPEGLNNRGVTLVELMRFEDALANCDQALVARPGYADALYNRGNALRALGRPADAVASYDEALALAPDRIDALNNRGLSLTALQRHEDALASFERVLAAAPHHIEALHNRAKVLMAQERLAEALAAYDRILEVDPERIESIGNRALVLAKLDRHEEAIRGYQKALGLAPDSPDILTNCGNSLIALDKFDEALVVFHKALTIDPAHFPAHTNRGNALMRLNRLSEAADSYEKAVTVAPDEEQGFNNRGVALVALGRFEEALASYDRAIELNPKFAAAHINRGNLFGAMARPAEALVNYLHALELNPDHAEARWNASLARLTLGQFQEGWCDYERRWYKEEAKRRKRNFSQPLWLGEEPVAGRTILLHAEQGLGDTLQFVRYAPLLARRGAKVILDIQPPLKSLLAGVEGIVGIFGQGEALPPFDLHCPLMSLPLAFGTELDTVPSQVPYLGVVPERVARWRDRVGAGRSLHVGVAWSGSTTHGNNRNRSIALSKFATLFADLEVEFIAIQKDLSGGEAGTLRRHANVMSVGEELGDFADTAAVISLLDLVVAVDTSVVHLAGALGKPVWVLVPFAPDFRWLLTREDSPWYPTMRLFRQPALGDWDSVLDRVGRELRPLVSAR
jgi:tetratricopeptide (TPR) repeat protein